MNEASVSLKRTVCSSMASAPSTFSKRKDSPCPSAFMRSNENTTSSAVSGIAALEGNIGTQLEYEIRAVHFPALG